MCSISEEKLLDLTEANRIPELQRQVQVCCGVKFFPDPKFKQNSMHLEQRRSRPARLLR